MSDLANTIRALYGGVPLQEAMPFGAANTPEGTQTALGKAIVDTATLPKRALGSAANYAGTGVYDPAPIVESAMTLATGGMPMAEKGALGIFGGKNALTADRRALNEAEQMRAGGKSMEDIRSDTGWFNSPTDNLWRFEIPDDKMVLKHMPTVEGDRAYGSLSSLVHHPKFYEAYPQAGFAPFSIQKQTVYRPSDGKLSRGAASFEPDGSIFVAAPYAKEGTSLTGHELQHLVQRVEGFSPGSNPNHYAKLIEDEIRNNRGLAAYDFDALARKAEGLYLRTAGEVESRNVENRLKFNQKQRDALHPWQSQDIPYQDQVVFDPVRDVVRALREKK